MKTLILTLAALLVAASAMAQGSYTAATCNQTDVNAVINGPTHTAVAGDTINIPSTGSPCTWTSGITITVPIQVLGAGTPNTSATTFGAGTITTQIVDALNDGATPIFDFSNLPVSSYLARISSLNITPGGSVTNGFSPLAGNGVCNSSTCPNVRFDNLSFSGWVEGTTGTNTSWMIRTDNLFGVIDHVTVTDAQVLANINNSAYLGVGDYGDSAWAKPDAFGTANFMYFENNSFGAGVAADDVDARPPGGSIGGSRCVLRFNTSANATNYLGYTHGTETGQRMRGGRAFEIYGNTVTCATTAGCPSGSQFRSGVIYNWGNSYPQTTSGRFNNFLSLYIDRIFAGFPPWGYCGGQGGWDNNDVTTYFSGASTSSSVASGTLTLTFSGSPWTASQWISSGTPYSFVDTSITDSSGFHPAFEITSNGTNTLVSTYYGSDYWDGPPTFGQTDTIEILRSEQCIDQPARGAGTYLSGSTPSPSGWPSEPLDPVYEWMDKETGGTPYQGVVVAATAKLINNRDYYMWCNSASINGCTSFNGTVGVGSGTLAARPSTCTAGVGYFATDQGSWNGSGNGFGQGELFICGSSGWPSTASYTPYTYPHPLISGGGPVAGVSPSSLSFGNQVVSTTSSAQTVTLSNTGTASLTITGISIAGGNSGDFSQTNTCGSSLAAGSTCPISVTFTPSATGSRSATLAVVTNDPVNPTLNVTLSGTGIVPTVASSCGGCALSGGMIH